MRENRGKEFSCVNDPLPSNGQLALAERSTQYLACMSSQAPKPSKSTSPQAIRTEAAPAAIGPYSQAIRSGDLLFLSGQIALDPASGELVNQSLSEETHRVMKNLKAVLEAGGANFDTVLKTTIFLTDMAYFNEVNSIYATYFSHQAPARATVQVAGLPKGVRVEIDAIARIP